jgi:hypothetical protein
MGSGPDHPFGFEGGEGDFSRPPADPTSSLPTRRRPEIRMTVVMTTVGTPPQLRAAAQDSFCGVGAGWVAVERNRAVATPQARHRRVDFFARLGGANHGYMRPAPWHVGQGGGGESLPNLPGCRCLFTILEPLHSGQVS